MIVSIDREHGVALDDLAGLLIDPRVIKPGQPPRQAVSATEAPPHVLASLPARFVERHGGDDALLAFAPGILERGFGGDFLGSAVVGGIDQLSSLGPPGNQSQVPTARPRWPAESRRKKGPMARGNTSVAHSFSWFAKPVPWRLRPGIRNDCTYAESSRFNVAGNPWPQGTASPWFDHPPCLLVLPAVAIATGPNLPANQQEALCGHAHENRVEQRV